MKRGKRERNGRTGWSQTNYRCNSFTTLIFAATIEPMLGLVEFMTSDGNCSSGLVPLGLPKRGDLHLGTVKNYHLESSLTCTDLHYMTRPSNCRGQAEGLDGYKRVLGVEIKTCTDIGCAIRHIRTSYPCVLRQHGIHFNSSSDESAGVESLQHSICLYHVTCADSLV